MASVAFVVIGLFILNRPCLMAFEGTTSTLEQSLFRFNLEAEPETLDPAMITGATEMRIANNLFEGLLGYHPATLEPVAGVAKSWQISDNGLIYIFHLRQSQWSDDSPITAEDFIQSWERVLNPSTGAPYASQLFPIRGAQAYHEGQSTDISEVGVEALDDHTLKVELHTPCPYFLDLCAFVTLFPTPQHIIQQFGDRWTRPEHMVLNGPFHLKTWKPRQSITLLPRKDYWDYSPSMFDRVEALIIDDQDTAYKLFTESQLDWLSTIALPKVEEASWHPHYYAMPYMGIYFYRFNVNRKPFDQVEVRQALSHAVDRHAITRQITKGGELPATYYCPPVAGYQGIDGIGFDPDKARLLLDQAGYQDRSSFPEIEIFYNTSENHKKIAEAISEQWREILGIRVRMRNTEWKSFLSLMKNVDFGICRSSWIGDYGDPNTFFSLFRSNDGNNRTGWGHPDYDRWLTESQQSLNREERFELFRKMETLLVREEVPIIPIYIYVNKGMLNPKVKGWHANVRDLHPLKYLSMESQP